MPSPSTRSGRRRLSSWKETRRRTAVAAFADLWLAAVLPPEDAVEIRAGSLDDAPFALQPEGEIWVKRREPWLHSVADATQHDENRA